MEDDLGVDGGWTASAAAWIGFADGHASRTLLLDPAVLAEAGDVRGKRVLDVGCGEGRFSRRLAALGAQCVGLDPVWPMLEASTRAAADRETYVRGSGDSLPFQNETFDLVVFYLSLIDIADFRAAVREAARVLRPGGRLIAANISNIASPTTAGPEVDEQDRFLYYKVDRYLDEWPMTVEFLGVRVRNWHRPLSAYMDAYLGAGLNLRRYLEPLPQDHSLRADPRYESWFKVPSFDVMVWERAPVVHE